MSYYAQSLIVADRDIVNRVAAAVATLGTYGGREFAESKMWEISASEGWAVAYRDALDAIPTPEDPAAAPAPTIGRDPGVISDEMILAAVRKALGMPAEGTLEATDSEEEQNA